MAKEPNEPIESVNSGWYELAPIDNDPDTVHTNSAAPDELEIVQAAHKDLALEEFPEGPVGAATNEEKLGKTSPWLPGQQSIGRYRDTNPISSDRNVVRDEPESDAPIGSIEGQN